MKTAPKPRRQMRGVATHGLTHIAVAVADPQRSAAFYRAMLGARIVYRTPDFVQLQTPGAFDVLVFERDPQRAGRAGGITHFGFRLKKAADIARATRVVRAAGGEVVEHGEFVPGEPYLFGRDPDGYTFEIWFELPTAFDPPPPLPAAGTAPAAGRRRFRQPERHPQPAARRNGRRRDAARADNAALAGAGRIRQDPPAARRLRRALTRLPAAGGLPVPLLLAVLLLLFQTRNVPGVLDAPDPKQMEHAAPLRYHAVETGVMLPDGIKLGASSGVAFDRQGHLWVLNRGPHPLIEFDESGRFVKSMGEGLYNRAHGLRIAPDGSIWTTDVQGHTVMKMNPAGEVLLTLGTRGKAGRWDESAGTRLLYEPADIGFAANGDVFIVEGHGRGEGTVLRFDKDGRFVTQWGGKGSDPGKFDQPHSILVTPQNEVLVADRENHRVQIFDLNGRFLRQWRFAGLPCGLLQGPDRQLYLATGFSGQILQLDSNGRAVRMMGEPGPGPALGQFGEAHYMAIAPNSDIYVADTINAKLHRFVRD